jgi:lysophospholipase L1-like esterase
LRKAINKLGPGIKDFAVRFTRYQPLPVYDHPDDARWKLMRGVLLKWIGELHRPAIIFVIPLYHYIEETASPDGYQARMGELNGLPNVTLVDALAEFHKHPPSERRKFRFQRDAHPSPAGHRVLAESLAGAIRPMLDRKQAVS